MKIFQVFNCNMDSELYKQIIEDYMFSFIASKYNYTAVIHQDNDTKHSSLICRDALNNLGLIWVYF